MWSHVPEEGRAADEGVGVETCFEPLADGTLSYSYDGSLLKSTAWSGAVTGSVERTYDSFFRVSQTTVNGAMPISIGYDNDGLVTSVGAMTITRDPSNGLMKGSTLGVTSDSMSYDAFGALQTYTATANGATVFSDTLERDALGRITKKTETLAGATHVYQYTYYAAGWLKDVTTDGAVTASYTYNANGNRLTKTTASVS